MIVPDRVLQDTKFIVTRDYVNGIVKEMAKPSSKKGGVRVKGTENVHLNWLSDVVTMTPVPLGFHLKSQIEQNEIEPDELLEAYSTSSFRGGGIDTELKLVDFSVVNREQDTVRMVFLDKNGNYMSFSDVSESFDKSDPFMYITQDRRTMKRLHVLLTGYFSKAEHAPITFDKQKGKYSDYCFCEGDENKCLRHMPMYKKGQDEDAFDDIFLSCDSCGHWCHGQCLVENGCLDSEWYKEYKDAMKNGDEIEDSFFEKDAASCVCMRCAS